MNVFQKIIKNNNLIKDILAGILLKNDIKNIKTIL
jgi:hypothetical protein